MRILCFSIYKNLKSYLEGNLIAQVVHLFQIGLNLREALIKEKNTFKMKAEKTFKLTNKGLSKIHTYKVGKQPVRSYGHNMTEEFALDYLSKGSEEQIAERKKWFNVLPEVKKVKKAPKGCIYKY